MLVGVDVNSDGTPRTATYSISPPGGTWTAAADGIYTVSLLPNQVFNLTGAAAPAVTLGTFRVVTPMAYTVTTLADGGPGSLRDVIGQADAMAPAAATIAFDPSLFSAGPATIALLSPLPIITESLTLTGPAMSAGQPQLTVRPASAGSASFGVFSIAGTAATVVTLANMIVSGGSTTGSGGGILDNGATLFLSNMVVSGNSSGNQGGGIFAGPGTVMISNSTVANNTAHAGGGGIYVSAGGALRMTDTAVAANATSSQYGGGIFLGAAATMTLSASTISGNSGSSGGGIYASQYVIADLTNCTISSNRANGGGGGIQTRGNGTITLDNCEVLANTASSGGGVCLNNNDTLIVSGCSINDNSAGSALGGGGILAFSSFKVSITNSTISDNTGAAGGGAFFYGGTILQFFNSTISGNSASGVGGGLYLDQAAGVMRNCTIAGNTGSTGGGIDIAYSKATSVIQNSTIVDNVATSTSAVVGQGGGGIAVPAIYPGTGVTAGVLVQGTIVAANSSANGTPDIAAITAPNFSLVADYDLIGVNAGFTLSAGSGSNLTGTVAAPLDPRLGPVQDNGGATSTLAPLPGSPVIDAGSNPANLPTDQRGNSRSLGAAPDIGAVEHVPGVPFAARGSLPDVISIPGGTSYQFTVTYYDDAAIDVATAANINAVHVTGPNGFSAVAIAATADNPTDGSPRTVTYTIVPPGGAWSGVANGTYTVSVQSNQVFNTTGAAVPAVTVGTFQVTLPVTFTVTTLAATGPGSLSDAITQANKLTPTADTIAFAPSLFTAGPVTIATALPTITESVTVVGPGAGLLTIHPTASGLTVNGSGSVIVNVSGLTLSGGSGGAAHVTNAVATFTGVTFSDPNSSGLVISAGGVVTVRASTVANNHGSGITVAAGASLVLDSSTVFGNSATSGGGINLAAGASLLVENSTISANTTTGSSGRGAGIFIVGAPGAGGVAILSSTISGNSAVGLGGGLFMTGATGPTGLTIRDSTIAGNTASSGGGIDLLNVNGTVLIQNSTITGNTATTTSTVPGYGGGGIAAQTTVAASVLDVQSTILAGNIQITSTANRPDISTTPTSIVSIVADHSLIGVADTVTLAAGSVGNRLGTAAAPLNSMLGPLASNGGPTQTILPLPGSPVVDAGSNPANLATDQSGNPRVNGFAPDIGAVEVTSPGLPVAIAGPTPAVTAAGSASYQFTVTFESGAAISVSSLGTGDVVVTGPAGIPVAATLVSVDNSGDGTPRTVTYAFAAPARLDAGRRRNLFHCGAAQSGVRHCRQPASRRDDRGFYRGDLANVDRNELRRQRPRTLRRRDHRCECRHFGGYDPIRPDPVHRRSGVYFAAHRSADAYRRCHHHRPRAVCLRSAAIRQRPRRFP